MKRRRVPHKNRIGGQWSPRPIEMLESPAYRALSLSTHRVVSRIEIELAKHGGNDNGRLPVTKQAFIAYGVHNAAVAPAIREAEALGFIHVTERGRGGNSEHRKPNLFRVTFAHGRNSQSESPTHDWRNIKTIEEALAIAQTARAGKSETAVAIGKRVAGKNRNRFRKPTPAPVPETGTEKVDFRFRKPTPAEPKSRFRKPALLSRQLAKSAEGCAAGNSTDQPKPTDPPERPWPTFDDYPDFPEYLRRTPANGGRG